jgi:hypothetical protein
MATKTDNTTRRALLVGLAATPLAAVPVLATEPNPDAGLLDILKRHAVLLREMNNGAARTDPEVDELGDRIRALQEEAGEWPIATLAGLSAYVGMLRGTSEICTDEPDGGEALVLHLFDRIEAMQARA